MSAALKERLRKCGRSYSSPASSPSPSARSDSTPAAPANTTHKTRPLQETQKSNRWCKDSGNCSSPAEHSLLHRKRRVSPDSIEFSPVTHGSSDKTEKESVPKRLCLTGSTGAYSDPASFTSSGTSGACVSTDAPSTSDVISSAVAPTICNSLGKSLKVEDSGSDFAPTIPVSCPDQKDHQQLGSAKQNMCTVTATSYPGCSTGPKPKMSSSGETKPRQQVANMPDRDLLNGLQQERNELLQRVALREEELRKLNLVKMYRSKVRDIPCIRFGVIRETYTALHMGKKRSATQRL